MAKWCSNKYVKGIDEVCGWVGFDVVLSAKPMDVVIISYKMRLEINAH